MAPRDYYADLELPPTADIQDIRKQFRKLALKYHPDRNPGREQEVNAQFQIIQTAHEVLSDTEQKSKYDASRRKANNFTGASGVRGNPWSNVSAQYPPPPRRGQPTRAQPSQPSRTQNPRNQGSGAERWQKRFASGVPPTAKQQGTSDHPSEAKINAAQAFANMRKTQPKPAEPQQQGPPPPPPRTESAKQRQEASFGARKTSFHPRSTMGGDEPPVTRSNYTSRPASERYAVPPEFQPEVPPRPPPMADPLSQFREKEQDDRDSRQSSPYMAQSGEKTNPFDGVPLGRAKSTNEPSRRDESAANDEPSARQRSTSTPNGDGHGDSHGPNPDVPPEARRKAPMRSRSKYADMAGSEAANAPNPPATSYEGAPQQASPSKNGGPSIFSFPVKDDTFDRTETDRQRFTKSSADDINTSFTNQDDAASWQFKAGGADANPAGASSPAPPSPPKRPAMAHAAGVQSESGTSEHPFNPEGWSDKFGPQTFEIPPSQAKPGSPTRPPPRANSRKAKTPKPAGAASTVNDSSSDDEDFQWGGRKAQAEPTFAQSPQAMDIDSPPAVPADRPAQPPHSARNINYEPARPEWRPGNADAVNGNSRAEEYSKKSFNPNAQGSEDSEEFRATLADLKNVPPFTQQASGLKSMTDLKDNLPFESRAAPEVPYKLPKVQHLQFPEAPAAPRLPQSFAVNGQKPSPAAWQSYVKEFEMYLQDWDKFNAAVVDHFGSRKAHIAKARDAKGYAFLESRADADIQEYYTCIEQDIDVRRRWSAACEDHEKRFCEFMALRTKMK